MSDGRLISVTGSELTEEEFDLERSGKMSLSVRGFSVVTTGPEVTSVIGLAVVVVDDDVDGSFFNVVVVIGVVDVVDFDVDVSPGLGLRVVV